MGDVAQVCTVGTAPPNHCTSVAANPLQSGHASSVLHLGSSRSVHLTLLGALLAMACATNNAGNNAGQPSGIASPLVKTTPTVQPVSQDIVRIDTACDNLKSDDEAVRREAIRELAVWGAAGELRAPQIAAALLERLRHNTSRGIGYEERYEQHTQNERTTTILIAAENVALAEAAAASHIADALPLVSQILAHVMAQPEDLRSETSSRSLASSIYQLSAKRVAYWQASEAASALYEPSAIEAASTRMVLRPDLVPVGGITASLSLLAGDAIAAQIIGSKPLRITLAFKNHSDEAIQVHRGPGDFVFSIVAGGQRHLLEARELPTAAGTAVTTSIAPKQSITIAWTLDSVRTSAFHELFGPGGLFIHVEHTPTGLKSNTVASYYFGRE